MSPKKDYKVIEAASLAELERAVKIELNNGWYVTGGVAIEILPGLMDPRFFQAIYLVSLEE
jgi:hypothetical protein